MATRVDAWLLLAAALLLMAVGAVLLSRELAPYAYGYGTRQQVLTRLAQASPPIPPSISGTTFALETCANALDDLQLRLGPTARRLGVADTCARAAEDAIRALPGSSYAHYVSALANIRRNDPEAGLLALQRSEAYGPTEQWIAELRVRLAEDNFARLGPYAEEGHRADLALLAQSRRGIRAVAARYVADAGFRERITRVVEALPMDVQQRFVSLVRAEARAAGGGG